MVQGLLHFLFQHSVHNLSLCSILSILKKKEKVLIRQKSPWQGLDMKSSIVCDFPETFLQGKKEVQISLQAGVFPKYWHSCSELISPQTKDQPNAI